MKLPMLTTAAVFAVAIAYVAPPAQAGVILQPASASSPTATIFAQGSPTNTIDQSGLSVGYTSGVTDFDTYIASTPTHDSSLIATLWLADPLVGSIVDLDFNLGGSYAIESMAFWNRGSNHISNTRAFQMLVADNAAFTGATVIGNYVVNPNTGPFPAVPAEVFTFASTTARYVRLRIDVSEDSEVRVGEVAFEVTAQQTVPEPGTPALVLACGLALLAVRRPVGARQTNHRVAVDQPA